MLLFRQWVTVGGIRSTGVTSGLAIAELVRKGVQDDIGVAPSGVKPPPVVWDVAVPYWHTQHGTVVMDGAQYKVTHPLMQFGIWDKKAKL